MTEPSILMSTAPKAVDECGELSLVRLDQLEHHDHDSSAVVPGFERGHDMNETPLSFLSLPREVRDMVYEVVAVSCEASKPPNVESSRTSGYEHLFVAEGSWKIWSNDSPPRFEHSYNNLLLVNRQINAEIAVAAGIHLPFSVCIGTYSADSVLFPCPETDVTLLKHFHSCPVCEAEMVTPHNQRLNNAKAIVLSLVDIDIADPRFAIGFWNRAITPGLQIFLVWYVQRISDGYRPRLVIMIDNFFCIPLTSAFPDWHFYHSPPMATLDIWLSRSYVRGDEMVLKEIAEIGYVWSEEIESLLCGDRSPLVYPDPNVFPSFRGAVWHLCYLLPWAHLSTDTRRVRYSPKVDFRRMP